MIFEMNARSSDSPLVQQVWHAHSVGSGRFQSVAKNHMMMVVTWCEGKPMFTVRGPETRATPLDCDMDGEWIGIEFRPGTFMPNLPVRSLVDRDLTLPGAGNRSFWLDGAAWQFPDFENADSFVDRLVRQGVLAREPVVDAVLRGQLSDISVRSVQRRFVQATGLSQRAIQQIERAKVASLMLQRGVSVLDTVFEAGYCDQPHLTRSLKRFLGQTPTEIAGSTTFG